MRLRLVGMAATVAGCLLSTLAQAQPIADASASLTQFSISVTDLRPEDSTAPSLTLIPGSIITMYSSGQEIYQPDLFFPPYSATFSDGVTSTSLEVTANSAVASTSLRESDMVSTWNWDSSAWSVANFLLSPHTSFAISGLLSVRSVCVDCFWASANAEVYVAIGDAPGVSSSLWAEHGAVVPDLFFSFSYANEADDSITVRLSPSVSTYTSITSGVPEPPAWLLAAVGLFGLATRRRVVRRDQPRALGQSASDSNRWAAFATTA